MCEPALHACSPTGLPTGLPSLLPAGRRESPHSRPGPFFLLKPNGSTAAINRCATIALRGNWLRHIPVRARVARTSNSPLQAGGRPSPPPTTRGLFLRLLSLASWWPARRLLPCHSTLSRTCEFHANAKAHAPPFPSYPP
jgi:hypothetical protein